MYKIDKEEFIKFFSKNKSRKELADIFKVSPSTISARIKEFGLKSTYRPKSKKDNIYVFDSINTEEKAYWLGFLYADGCIFKHGNSYKLQLALSSKDEDHVIKFTNFIGRNTKCHTKGNVSRCSIQNSHLCNTLINYGCVPKKSCILQFPEKSIFQKEDLIYDFIRGYVDGDGCITYTNNKISKISIIGTREFLAEIQKLFPQCFSLAKDTRWKNNTYYIYTKNRNSFLKVANKLYKNSTISLTRKYKRYKIGVLQSNL